MDKGRLKQMRRELEHPMLDPSLREQYARWDHNRMAAEQRNADLQARIDKLERRIMEMEKVVGDLGRAAAQELKSEQLEGFRPYRKDRRP